jgi:hypothetical protein
MRPDLGRFVPVGLPYGPKCGNFSGFCSEHWIEDLAQAERVHVTSISVSSRSASSESLTGSQCEGTEVRAIRWKPSQQY